MNIWAVIPMKPINEAKSRLSGILNQSQREQLVMALFRHTISQLKDLTLLQGILVVSSDPIYKNSCDENKIFFLPEEKTLGLNISVDYAIAHLIKLKADAVLVIHGDLPLLNYQDLIPLIEQTPVPGVTLVADRHQRGTNILFATPPNIIPFCFGENSLINHQRTALERNIPVHITLSAPLSLDIDTPEDYFFYKNFANVSDFSYESA